LKFIRQNLPVLKDYGLAAIAAIILALTIRFFLFEAYRIPTRLMEPTLFSGDLIFATKWPFGIRLPGSFSAIIKGRAPQYGEVVIYTPVDNPNMYHIRRVVGLPGDNVAIRAGRILLNRKELPVDIQQNSQCGIETQNNLSHGVCISHKVEFKLTHVSDDQLFVVSDHRMEDSKVAELIPFNSLRAKAFIIWLSIAPTGGIVFDRIFKRIY